MTGLCTDLFLQLAETHNAAELLTDAVTASEQGKLGDAIALCVRAVRSSPDDITILRDAAGLFGALGQPAYVADCYSRLELLEGPNAMDLSARAGALLSVGAYEDALGLLLRAQELEPDNLTGRQTLAFALSLTNRPRDALQILLDLRPDFLGDTHFCSQLAAALRGSNFNAAAVRLSKKIIAANPDNWAERSQLASWFIALDRYEEAYAELSTSGVENHSIALQMLALICHHTERFEEGVARINAAIKLSGSSSVYLNQRGAIYSSLHRFDNAADDFLAALDLDPQDEGALRSAFLTLTEAGRYKEALPIGAKLVGQFPQETGLAQTLQIVMERSVSTSTFHDRSAQTLAERFGEPPRVDHPMVDAKSQSPLMLQWRIILALILRETRTRFGRSRIGYAWVIFEPLAHIGIMITLIATFSHSGSPPIGDSFALFYFTGIIPFHLFTHTIGHLMMSVPENRPLLQLPKVKVIDVYIARAILELVTEFCVMGILLTGFVFFGLNITPINPTGVVFALLLVWLCAFGLGLLSAVLVRFFSGWERIWGAISSLLYFGSGTFYIPRMMPEEVRNILAWSPTLQGIEMVRVNYFNEPYPYWLDVGYLCGFALISMAAGLCIERLYRGKMLETE